MEVPGKKLQAGPSTADTTYCQPCEQDDEILPAEAYCTVCKEFFCSRCASVHRKQKMSRSHALLNKSDMPTTINVVEDECTELCEIHPKEVIKYFCPTHHTLNCGHCVVHNHRTCYVDVISDVSKAFKDGQEYGDVIKTIARLFENIDSCASDVENNVEAVAKLGENEIYKLRRYREEVNKYFEERERALSKLIEETKHVDEELLGSLKPKYANLKFKLEEINVTLKAQENNMIQLFIETKRAKNLLESLQNDLADINNDNVIHHYEFRKDPATERLIASDTGIGTLENIMTENTTTSVSQATVDLTRTQFTHAADIQMKYPTDIKNCYLSSMLHLAGSRLLLADYNNKKIKMLDMQTNSRVSEISVPGQPWDMCILPGDRVAVTMRKEGIQLIETREQLDISECIKVDGDCRGIAYYKNSIIVSYNNGNVKILNMNGHVLREIRIEGVGQTLFERTLYLAVVCEGSTAVYYVSDTGRNTITKLDMNLNIIKAFHDPWLKEPRGIIAIGDQLLICNSGGSTIMSLDMSTGQLTKLLQENRGIQSPVYAYYCPQESKLFVLKRKNNSIKVYNAIK